MYCTGATGEPIAATPSVPMNSGAGCICIVQYIYVH